MIHKYKFKDKNIVLDVNSGAIHLVSDSIYDILGFYKEKTKEEIYTLLGSRYKKEELEKAYTDIQMLEEDDMLFSDDSQITNEMLEGRGSVIKAMCLHVAHDCNLRCKYCFADKGAYVGERALMSLETGKKAIDFLLNQSGSRRNLELDFFGGEPLMNFEVVKQLVRYGREAEKPLNKNIRFTITTNGVLLDDAKIDFINQEMSNVILSVDGRKAVNDEMRQTINGQGSYDVIMDNYLRFVEKREGLYYVRGTFTAKNLDFAEDVKHLVDLGFKNVSVEPVVTDPTLDYALHESDSEVIKEEYDHLIDLFLEYEEAGKDFSFFHFNLDLDQGPCVYKRVAGCGAGTEYVAVSPEGDIYPCHQFVGNESFKLGNVKEDQFKNKLFDRFNQAHIYNKEACRECWAKFYCSGGCHANAYHSNGDVLKPYELGCELQKKRLECAIGIKAVEACR